MHATESKSIRMVIVGILTTGFIQVANALGLGPISVQSHIGEPLQATISVSDISATDAASTSVGIASKAAYLTKGISKLPSHDKLRFSLQPSARGYVIRISTADQVREPFINFVLSVREHGKEILREYAVFLDPGPSLGSVASNSNTIDVKPVENLNVLPKPKLLATSPASTQDTGWKGKVVAKKAIEPMTAKKASHTNIRRYGPVRKGETLFTIAEKIRPSSDYSVQTVMRQIFLANRKAFSANNLDSLMAGYTLHIPVLVKEMVALPQAKRHTVKKKAAEKDNSASVDEASDKDATSTDLEVQADETPIDQESLDKPSDEILGQSSEASDTEVMDERETEEVLNEDDTKMENVLQDQTLQDQTLQDQVLQNQAETSDAVSTTEVSKTEDSTDIELSDAANNSDANNTVEEMVDVTIADTAAGDTQESAVDSSISNAQTNGTEQAAVEKQNADVAVEVAKSPNAAQVEQKNESFFNKTYAILPMWQWMLIGLLLLILIAAFLFKSRRKSDPDEIFALDQAEMDALNAKINAIEQGESDEYHNSNTSGDSMNHGNEEDDFASNDSGFIIDDSQFDFGDEENNLNQTWVADQSVNNAENTQKQHQSIDNLDNDKLLDDDEENSPALPFDDYDLDFFIADEESDGKEKLSGQEHDDIDSIVEANKASNVEGLRFESDDLDFFLEDEKSDGKDKLSGQENVQQDDDFGFSEGSNDGGDAKGLQFESDDLDFFLADEKSDGKDKLSGQEHVQQDDDFGFFEDSNDGGDVKGAQFESDDLDFFLADEPIGKAEQSSDEPVANKHDQLDEDDLMDLESVVNDSSLQSSESNAEESSTTSTTSTNNTLKPSSLLSASSQVNPEEMEINLDLANSFVATGHGERAISWLEEVSESGTKEQQERAQQLLKQIRGA